MARTQQTPLTTTADCICPNNTWNPFEYAGLQGLESVKFRDTVWDFSNASNWTD